MSKAKRPGFGQGNPKIDAFRMQLRPFLKEILKERLEQELKQAAENPQVVSLEALKSVVKPEHESPEVKSERKTPEIKIEAQAQEKVKVEAKPHRGKSKKKKAEVKSHDKYHKEDSMQLVKSDSVSQDYERTKIISQMVLDLRIKDYPIVQSATMLDGDLDHFKVITTYGASYICEFTTDGNLNLLRGFPEALLGSCKAVKDS